VLVNVLPAHAELHDVLKLDTTFPTYSSEVDAVNSFLPGGTVPSYDLLQFLKEEAERNHPDRNTENKPA